MFAMAHAKQFSLSQLPSCRLVSVSSINTDAFCNCIRHVSVCLKFCLSQFCWSKSVLLVSILQVSILLVSFFVCLSFACLSFACLRLSVLLGSVLLGSVSHVSVLPISAFKLSHDDCFPQSVFSPFAFFFQTGFPLSQYVFYVSVPETCFACFKSLNDYFSQKR